MPIDVRGIFEPGWTNAGTSTTPGEPMKTRLAILQELEDRMAAMQKRGRRQIKPYTEGVGKHPYKDETIVPAASPDIYVNSHFLEHPVPNMEYRLAAMLITEQLMPQNWTKLSEDEKIQTLGLLEQTMAIQQISKPPNASSRPPRSISAVEGEGQPLFKLEQTGWVIGKENLASETAGLDILDAMVCKQLDYETWNSSSRESRLSTLQLAEYGMAARQGRFPRQVKAVSMEPNSNGSYNDNTPDILKISLEKLDSDIDEDFTLHPISSRKISDFPNYEMLDTVIHEGRHAFQHDITRGIIKPETLSIAPEVVAKWKENQETYLTSKNHSYTAYRFQPIEADANDTAYTRISQLLSGTADNGYLALKTKQRRSRTDTAEAMLGTSYLEQIERMVVLERDIQTKKEVQPIEIHPGRNLDTLLIDFSVILNGTDFSPERLINKYKLDNKPPYKKAVSLLEETLLTENERQLPDQEKEKQINLKLSQLYFGEEPFSQLYKRARKSFAPKGYDIIYAAMLLTEAMEGQRLITKENAMPGPAALKLGSDFVPILRPVPAVPRVKPTPPEITQPPPRMTQPPKIWIPEISQRPSMSVTKMDSTNPHAGLRPTGKFGKAQRPGRLAPDKPKPVPSSRQKKNSHAGSPIIVTKLLTLQSKEERAYQSALRQYEARERYNDAAKRNAAARQFKAIGETMYPSLVQCQSASYGYSDGRIMPGREFGIAVGVLLNRGYKMSDILEPNQLQAAKKILGYSIRKEFAPGKTPLSEAGKQFLIDAAGGYQKFQLKSELQNLNSKADSDEETAQMFADSRFQPGILRMIGGFGEAFQEFESYSSALHTEISAPDQAKLLQDIAPVSRMCSILSPERVKAVFDYYQSPEYLHGTVNATKEPEQKAAEATLIIQEHLVRNQNKSAAEQVEDSAAFEAIPEIHTQAGRLRGMSAEQLSAYIQENRPIAQFLSGAGASPVIAATPPPVAVPVVPHASSVSGTEGIQAKQVEEIDLGALTESLHSAPEKPGSPKKPVVPKPMAKKPGEIGRRK